ncbi:serine hydrolase [Nocardia sp. NPDC052566]|uniref:serine hydrolase n=1 Tax=Nocardia sp. NPDC052566 TaxID=3364330 RepID=UPI0037C63E0E
MNTKYLGFDDLARVATPSDPALAPDGSRVVYVLRTVDPVRDTDIRALWQVVPGSEPTQLTRGTADICPRWSPDGRTIAFLRAEDGPAQLWLLPAAGGEPERITELPLGAGEPVWSPDGTRIAFTAPVDTTGSSLDPHAPVHITSRTYKIDGTGWLRGFRSHIFVLDLADGSIRQVTDGDFHAGTPAWSPDGTRLVCTDSLVDDDDPSASAVRIADAAATRREPRRIGSASGTVSAVVWGGDGASLLAVATVDTEVRNNRLLRIPADGGESADLTAGFDRNLMPGGPGYPGALPAPAGADAVLFCARDRGYTHLYLRDETGIRKLVGGDRAVAGVSVAAGHAALVVSSTESFGEIVLLTLASGAQQALTRHTTTALPDITPIPVQERVFTVSDGTEVHGWLLRDPAAPAGGPLLVDAHGGPHNAWNPVWDWAHAYHQVLAARGWTVLLLNPRGSDGYGEEFLRAALGAWGRADEHDFLEPIDQLIDEGIADSRRIALSGYSYGGYVACWLPTRTDRFAAVVAGGVLSDLGSFIGTSDTGSLLVGTEIGSGVDAVAQLSPMTYVDQVTTPTLVLQGAAEARCPLGQAEQWYAALRERGVPAELVVYPGASHLFILDGKPSHRMDFNRRIVDWVIRHTRAHAPGEPAAIAPLDAAHWQRRLTTLAERHGIPGAVLAISHGDSMIEVAHGVLNLETGVPVTTDSLFQIGSITKVWTAAAIMRLVDQGKLDLDTPLAEILPELRRGDSAVFDRVTMRHLLIHTSGIDGDVFTDTGRGDDCLERYVAELATVPVNHPIDATWSYCNSGFSLAGRVLEVLTGSTWDAAMRELLFEPLGLRHTVTLPEEALLHRAAVGHMPGPDGTPRRADQWYLPRSSGPAGAIATSARDVLTFARMHLDDGIAPDGERMLSAEAVAQMQAEQVRLPFDGWVADSWGLGWFRGDWGGHRVIGHDGGTIGQVSMLRVLPGHRLAFTVLTNGGEFMPVMRALTEEIAAELAGVTAPEAFGPPAEPVRLELSRYVGVYERTGIRHEVFEGESGLVLRSTLTGELAEMIGDKATEERVLVPVAEGVFAARVPLQDAWESVNFYEIADGTRYLHAGVRATPERRSDAG